MKVVWDQAPEALEALSAALGFEIRDVPHLRVVEEDGTLRMVMAFHNFTEGNCEITAAGFPGPGLFTPSLLGELLSYPFIQLGLRRITAVTRTDNTRSQAQLRRMGFRVEGLVRNWYSDCHGILHGLTREECKWVANQPRRSHRTQ